MKKQNEVKHTPVKKPNEVKYARIGVFAGTFDPVHAGHIAFALQAVEAAKLDAVYFLPERRPRHKQGVEHVGHRSAMLERALKPHSKLHVLELPDKQFTVLRTLPRIRTKFPHEQLVFLVGSDVAKYMAGWPSVARLFSAAELCIGRRKEDSEGAIFDALAQAPSQPIKTTIIESHDKRVSSSAIRLALYEHRHIAGLLQSVRDYVKREWLYIKNPS